MLETRHIAPLDALRGVAAFAVLMYHVGIGGGVSGAPRTLGGVFSHGYLAVDLFFILSGFVIARSYEARLRAGLGLRRYMIIRLRRLYPVIAVGAGLGLLVAILVDMRVNLGLALAAQLLFVPFAISRYDMFVLNGVQWSLAFELVVNAVHAVLLRHLTDRWLAAIVVASFAALLAVALRHGSLEVGWSLYNLPGGAARVSFGFFTGVLIEHTLPRLRVPHLPIVWLCAGLLLLLALPFDGSARDPIVVALFPALVAAAVRASTPIALIGLCRQIGFLSYPVYALHFPILTLASTDLLARGLTGSAYAGAMLAAAGGAILLAITVDWFLDMLLQLAFGRRAVRP